MINILISHHIAIVAELDRSNSVETRGKAFAAINEAIAIFERVSL